MRARTTRYLSLSSAQCLVHSRCVISGWWSQPSPWSQFSAWAAHCALRQPCFPALVPMATASELLTHFPMPAAFSRLLGPHCWHEVSECDPLFFSLTTARLSYRGHTDRTISPNSARSKVTIPLHVISKHFILTQIGSMLQVVWRKTVTMTERFPLFRKPPKGHRKSDKCVLLSEKLFLKVCIRDVV